MYLNVLNVFCRWLLITPEIDDITMNELNVLELVYDDCHGRFR